MPLLNVDFNISLCLLCINVMVKDLLSRGLATSNKTNTNSKSSHTVIRNSFLLSSLSSDK